jgi:hypothetical protein
MKMRLLVSLVGLASLVGCNLTLVADAQVQWKLEGTCAQLGIYQWLVSLQGPEYVAPHTVLCSTSSAYPQSYGAAFSIAEGTYVATVQALDANGTALGRSRSSQPVIVRSGAIANYLDAGTFTANDFSPQVHVYYSINGTVDGTDEGLSWDLCSEVGAAYLRVTIDGTTTQDLTCGTTAATMNGYVSVAVGTHTFSAVLLNSSKTPITTQTNTETLSNLSLSQPGQISANFAWDSFLSPIKENTLGWYWFSTAFEGGLTCAQMTGVVTGEISLIKLNGTAVTPAPQVCDPNNFCFYADGNGLGQCNDSTVTQIMKSSTLKWGSYKLLLQATKNDGINTACFSVMDDANNKEVDIIIGAGQTNPVDQLTLKKIYPAASGCP